MAFLTNAQGLKTSLFEFHILCFNIYNVIVVDLDFMTLSTYLVCTLYLNLKLSHILINRQLLACFLIYSLLVNIISLSFF